MKNSTKIFLIILVLVLTGAGTYGWLTYAAAKNAKFRFVGLSYNGITQSVIHFKARIETTNPGLVNLPVRNANLDVFFDDGIKLGQIRQSEKLVMKRGQTEQHELNFDVPIIDFLASTGGAILSGAMALGNLGEVLANMHLTIKGSVGVYMFTIPVNQQIQITP